MSPLEIVLIVICVLLIILVLMQSSKAEGAGAILLGGSSDLFKNRKERGSELVISRTTMVLGLAFVIISLVITFL